MKTEQEYLEDLKEIRGLMERSSKFVSLSGLSGILAGVYALACAGIAYFYIYTDNGRFPRVLFDDTSTKLNLLLLGVVTLVITIVTGIFLTVRKAKDNGEKPFNKLTARLTVNLLIPLVAGGIAILIMLEKGFIGFTAPFTLIFYGLALINASKYTYSDIRSLGIVEVILGLIALYVIGYGILFWALGFGVGHIVYGTIMHFKYDRK
ncbi:MAG: hypothetical protein NXI20_17430 [bacterium]|nr:hypothetical protein [bacterium]